MAPLKVALGTDPRNPLSLPLPKLDLTTDQEKKALEIIVQTKAVQDLARGTALKTRAAMELQANKKRKEVDFTIGDSVYVSKKGFTTPARNLKNSSTLLETFHKDYPDAAGPPLKLAHCIRVAATDEYDDDHLDDDKAA